MLLRCASRGELENVKSIIEEKKVTVLMPKLDVNFRDEGGSTAMHEAARNGRIDVARHLIKCGAKIDVKDVDGVTPLRLAFRYGQGDFAILLMENKVPVDLKEKVNGKELRDEPSTPQTIDLRGLFLPTTHHVNGRFIYRPVEYPSPEMLKSCSSSVYAKLSRR